VGTVIPEPKELEVNVNAVVAYAIEHDAQVDLQNSKIDESDTTALRRKRIFVARASKVVEKVRQQLTHIRKNCLPTPNFKEGTLDFEKYGHIPMHMKCGNLCFSVAGTQGNEANNRILQIVLNAPRLGLSRGERATSSMIEDINHNANTKRRGANV